MGIRRTPARAGEGRPKPSGSYGSFFVLQPQVSHIGILHRTPVPDAISAPRRMDFSRPDQIGMKEWATISAMNKIEIVFTTLMSGLIAGPAVSFVASPTVSPTMAALCASECFPPK
jgi:hypothetical protein